MFAYVLDIVHRFCPCERISIVDSILSEAHQVDLTYIVLALLQVCVQSKSSVLRGGLGEIWNTG